ncbi:MAG: hypothetical protein GY938_15235, partial [Ketobacter sp.]|nr:hypothetical protein [Ketobacter sp.]
MTQLYGIDYSLDPLTGDLDLSTGDLQFTKTTDQSLQQRLQLRTNIWQGEWSFDTKLGLPVRNKLLNSVSGLEKHIVDAEYINQINLEPDVTSITNLSSSYDTATRNYVLQFVDVQTEGKSYNLNMINPEAKVYEYPTPTTVDIITLCNRLPVGYLMSTTGLDKYTNADGSVAYLLTCDGSVVDKNLYPELFLIYPVLPNDTTKQIVATYNSVTFAAGAQIGQVIITPQTSKWYDIKGNIVFDLLTPDGGSFSATTYPKLALEYPTLALPNIAQETGSPFPYMIVADLH